MRLPESDELSVAQLSKVFNETTNSYKFYWFLAILDTLQKTNNPRMSMQDLSLRMLATIWYPLDYYKLSFGAQDQFKDIAKFISAQLTINTKGNAPDLLAQLHNQLTESELQGIYQRVKQLLRWVPFRFIRPFFEIETKGLPDHHVNKAIVDLSNQYPKAPYHFNGDYIVINEVWVDYFQRYQYILRGFTSWHLVRFLQKNNPNVIAISEKLERPVERDFRLAKPFWNKYLTEHVDLTCIYSDQLITKDNISLDHYLPFSYVAHDQIWNLIPTTRNVNSAKNNWLPDTDLYFDKYAQLQFDAFQFYAESGQTKSLEDYSVLFRENTETIQNQPFSWFRERLSQSIFPQLQTAQNMGFSYPFIFK
jgi:HNH endonuclease